MAEHYSPERRTALMLCGTGADGAYHAGVLRALHETGLKIDIVAGRGIGALGAVLCAVDGAARLWEPGGIWRGALPTRLYRWRWPFRVVRWLLVALVAVLLLPVLVAALVLAFYPIALAIGMTGLDAGAGSMQGLLLFVGEAFGARGLPTWVPRAATFVVAVAVVVLAGGAALAWWQQPVKRRRAGSATWSLLGAPIDAGGAVAQATEALWTILKGGAVLKTPEPHDLSRRYAELLTENLGQPGFRELLIVVHDLDVRRDLVFGLLKEPFRRALFPPLTGMSARRAEAQDLAGVARDHVIDALSAALTLPAVSEPHLVTFSADAYWRGESHRLADRPGAAGRLIEEIAAAGAEQLIVVAAATEPPGPHELRPARVDGFGRIGEQLASADATALADALRHLQHRFQGTYVIRPAHNPVRPLDLSGADDEHSDRRHSLEELMERGYEDAYRQFIEPVLGASGERMTQIAPAE